MARIWKRGKKWYYRYKNGDGKWVDRAGSTDRRVTEELAREAETRATRIRDGISNPRAETMRRHQLRPLMEHLTDWHRMMLDRGLTTKHADLSLTRVRTLAEVSNIVTLSDLDPSRIQTGLARLRSNGRSLQTLNHFRACLRAFVRWAQADGRLDHVSDGRRLGIQQPGRCPSCAEDAHTRRVGPSGRRGTQRPGSARDERGRSGDGLPGRRMERPAGQRVAILDARIVPVGRRQSGRRRPTGRGEGTTWG